LWLEFTVDLYVRGNMTTSTLNIYYLAFFDTIEGSLRLALDVACL